MIFQSTPSTRRETCLLGREPAPERISIHSLHTEGDARSFRKSCCQWISIHSLHTEGDSTCMIYVGAVLRFQSTPSTRRETDYILKEPLSENISIHSLHTEGDRKMRQYGCDFLNFNPLPPHGGRPVPEYRMRRIPPFQSTPSTRRETTPYSRTVRRPPHFNPLPPHGGRRLRFRKLQK